MNIRLRTVGVLLMLAVNCSLRAQSQSGHIDSASPNPVAYNGTIYLSGWAADSASPWGPSDVRILVDGNYASNGANAQFNDGYNWSSAVDVSYLSSGQDHVVSIYIDSYWWDDNGWLFWDGGIADSVTIHINPPNQPPSVSVSADQTTIVAGQSTTLHVYGQDPDGNLRYVNLDEVGGPAAGNYFGPGNNFDAASPPNNGWNDIGYDTGSYQRDVTLTFSVAGTYTFAGAVEDDQGSYVTYGSTGGNVPTVTITVLQTQSINFTSPGDQPNGSVITLNATASSGLPVSYSVSGPASLSGNTLTLTGIGTVSVMASQGGNAQYAAAPNKNITFSSLNRAPSTTISANPTNIILGNPTTITTITATSTDPDGNLASQTISDLAPGSSSWVTGANWSGGPTGSHTLTWAVPASVLNVAGTWQIQASASDGFATSNVSSVSISVAKATPVFSNWPTNRGIANNTGYQVSSTIDLTATLSNPYSSSVTPPSGAITYSIVAGGSGPLTNGMILQPGTYTIRASYAGDNNYNSAYADAIWIIYNPVTTIQADVTNPSAGQTVTIYSGQSTTIYYGQTALITGNSADQDSRLVSQTIDYSLDGGTTWTSGTTWTGGPAGSNTLTWTVPFSIMTVGQRQIRASGTNSYGGVSDQATVTFTVAPATPVPTWPDKEFSTTHVVTTGDLNAAFANPYPSSAAPPSGAITYTFVSGGAGPVVPGMTLYPGTYVISATCTADANYNAASANATWTVDNQPPVTTLSASAANLAPGQTLTLTANATDVDNNLLVQVIAYLPPGSSNWVTAANWSGGPTGSDTLTWTPPASLITTPGTWGFLSLSADNLALSNISYVAVTVANGITGPTGLKIYRPAQ